MAKKNPYLLPEDVKPIHYDIELTPDLEKFTFAGKVNIDVVIHRPTSKITLHAADLKILSAEAFGEFASFKPVKTTHDKKMETVTLDFKTKLGTDIRCLEIKFQGELNNKMHGFYRTSYELNGQKHWGAATQFEATDARRCFPCWDEPAKKATFSVTLRVPVGMTALSNMPASSFMASGNERRVTFEKTPVMSTYLLAFVVAHLEYIGDVDKNGVPIRIWTTPGKEEWGRFAMECAKHTLPYFGEWFGIPYALPKMDMVALPDFAAGAMENWGLITYRETALLIDSKNSSQAARQRVAEVVDHELAHQWFGNLVTMEWWTDLWLNEGFASYMGPKAVDHQFPEWDVWTQHVASSYLSALHQDSLKNTHPIEIDVKNPYEIRETFDAITYAKGSVVNRMLEHYLGEDFKKGLRLYLKRHAYRNATTADLWKAMEEVSGKPVRDIMARYTRQAGYPVVFAEGKWKELGEGEGPYGLMLNFKQTHFLADGNQDKKSLLWKIPLSISLADGKQESVLMEKKSLELICPAAGAYKNPWIKLNAGQSGFYRTAYDGALWRELIIAVRCGEISKIDRIGLLDDSMALAKAGYMKTSQALDIIAAHENDKEFDYSVWSAIIGNLNAVDHILDKESKASFAEFATVTLWPAASKIGWLKKPNEKHTDALLRSMVLASLGGYGKLVILEAALMAFENFVKGEALDPDLKQVVYGLAARQGGEKELEALLKIYGSTDDHQEKIRVLRSLGAFRKPEIVKKVLDFAISDKVRSQDWFIPMVCLGMNEKARALAWEFLKTNWELVVKRYHEGGLAILPRTLDGIASGFTGKEEREDVETFFKAHRLEGTSRTIKQILETISANIKWLERDTKDIKNWLANR